MATNDAENTDSHRAGSTSNRWTPRFWAALILVLCLTITYVLWNSAQQASMRDMQDDFDFRTKETADRIVQRMEMYRQVLRGVRGFLQGSMNVDREAFQFYIAMLRLPEFYPGIQGIATAAIVPKAELNHHIDSTRHDGFSDYTLTPAGERDIYTSITHIEPFNRMNRRAFGFDMFTEPVRYAAMVRARDSGKASLSGKVTLVQDIESDVQPGFLMYLPVFKKGAPISTLEQRRANIVGWASAPFRINDFMTGLGGRHADDIRVRIYDGEKPTDSSQLYDSDPSFEKRRSQPAIFKLSRQIEIADHAWTLVANSQPAFEAQLDTDKPQLIAFAGVGISVLLALLVWVLASGRGRALALARRMTRELRTSEFRWKYALEGAGDGVWDWNRQTDEVLYSPQWKKMLGYEDSDIENRVSEWERLIHPADQARAQAALADYFERKTSIYVNELRMLCKDGSWKWIRTRGIAVSRDDQGKPLRMIGTHSDITEAKQNQESLQQSHAHIAAEQQRMKVILENSHDAFVAINRQGLITDWNTQAERTFGWSAEQALGKNLAELIIPEDQREAHNNGLRHFVNSGAGTMIGRRVEVIALHATGKEIPVELAIVSVPSGIGYAANAFIRDLTERKEAERKEKERTSLLEQARLALQHSQKLEAVGKLTGGVAHDFNNVLQIITGNLQLLLDDGVSKDAREKWLHSALNAVERGSKLSSQLLAFARRQPLQPQVVNIGRLVRNMDDLLRRPLGESIEIETIVTGGLWNTLIDPSQLENVILNLAINARDAMEGSGKLTIELGNAMLDDDYVVSQPDVPAGQYVVLAISDTGEGMAPEVIERAFEPFFTTKPEGKGTGLGLSMAYGFVKQSGGHIRIYSEIGVGTTMRIYLPRSHDAEEVLNEILEEAVVGGDETILVVEDDVGVQTTVVAMLKELGYHVMTAHDGESALQIIMSEVKIDLLFTDVVMPGTLRSPELARQAKERHPEIAILFTSGYTQNAIVHGGRLDPGVNLLSKPYRREQLARKIRHVISNQQQINQAQKPVATSAVSSALLPASVTQRIVVVEDNEDLRRIACDLLTLLGHQPRAAVTAEEALLMISDDNCDVLFTDVGLPGINGVELAKIIIKKYPGIKVIFATGYGDILQQPEGFNAVVLKKPYNIKSLQDALTVKT